LVVVPEGRLGLRVCDRLIVLLISVAIVAGCESFPLGNAPAKREPAPARRVVITQHDRRWEARQSESPRPSPVPATLPDSQTTVRSAPPTTLPPVPPPATAPIPAPATAAAAPAPVAPATQAIVLTPSTQPLIVDARVSLSDVPQLQLMPPRQPIPIQLPPLTVTLSPDSPPIRVVLQEPTTRPATAATGLTAPANAAATPAPPPPNVPSPAPEPKPAAAGWGLTLLFLAWVLLAGALGGAIRHFLRAPNGDAEPEAESDVMGEAGTPSPLASAMAAGAIVAFLVPLALGLIASDLLARARLHQTDLIPVLILCLFIGLMSDHVAERFRRSAAVPSGATGDSTPAVLAALVEAQVDMESDADDEADERIVQTAKSLDEDEAELLRAMAKGPDRFRSEGGLAGRAALDLPTVQEVLYDLEQQGYAGRLASPRTGERLWYLTRQGRKLAATMYVV
jgi:DNA-binding MarR family transcriptional regulator